MNDLQMAAKFREAADYLREHGWRRGSLGLSGGPRCLVGAMGSVGLHNWNIEWDGRGLASMSRAPVDLLVTTRLGMEAAAWNDQPGRTKEDVIAFFEGLAHDLELRHQIAATSPLPAESRHDAIISSLEAANV